MKKSSAIILGLGTEFIGLVAAFLYVGRWADERLSLGGFGLIGGLFAALAIWTAHFIWAVRSAARDRPGESLEKSED